MFAFECLHSAPEPGRLSGSTVPNDNTGSSSIPPDESNLAGAAIVTDRKEACFDGYPIDAQNRVLPYGLVGSAGDLPPPLLPAAVFKSLSGIPLIASLSPLPGSVAAAPSFGQYQHFPNNCQYTRSPIGGFPNPRRCFRDRTLTAPNAGISEDQGRTRMSQEGDMAISPQRQHTMHFDGEGTTIAFLPLANSEVAVADANVSPAVRTRKSNYNYERAVAAESSSSQNGNENPMFSTSTTAQPSDRPHARQRTLSGSDSDLLDSTSGKHPPPKECGLCLELLRSLPPSGHERSIARYSEDPAVSLRGSNTSGPDTTVCQNCCQAYHVECLINWRTEHAPSAAEASCPGCRLFLSKRLPLHLRQERKLSITLADVYMTFHNEPLIPPEELGPSLLDDHEFSSQAAVSHEISKPCPERLHARLIDREAENETLCRKIADLERENKSLQTELFLVKERLADIDRVANETQRQRHNGFHWPRTDCIGDPLRTLFASDDAILPTASSLPVGAGSRHPSATSCTPVSGNTGVSKSSFLPAPSHEVHTGYAAAFTPCVTPSGGTTFIPPPPFFRGQQQLPLSVPGLPVSRRASCRHTANASPLIPPAVYGRDIVPAHLTVGSNIVSSHWSSGRKRADRTTGSKDPSRPVFHSGHGEHNINEDSGRRLGMPGGASSSCLAAGEEIAQDSHLNHHRIDVTSSMSNRHQPQRQYLPGAHTSSAAAQLAGGPTRLETAKSQHADIGHRSSNHRHEKPEEIHYRGHLRDGISYSNNNNHSGCGQCNAVANSAYDNSAILKPIIAMVDERGTAPSPANCDASSISHEAIQDHISHLSSIYGGGMLLRPGDEDPVATIRSFTSEPAAVAILDEAKRDVPAQEARTVTPNEARSIRKDTHRNVSNTAAKALPNISLVAKSPTGSSCLSEYQISTSMFHDSDPRKPLYSSSSRTGFTDRMGKSVNTCSTLHTSAGQKPPLIGHLPTFEGQLGFYPGGATSTPALIEATPPGRTSISTSYEPISSNPRRSIGSNAAASLTLGQSVGTSAALGTATDLREKSSRTFGVPTILGDTRASLCHVGFPKQLDLGAFQRTPEPLTSAAASVQGGGDSTAYSQFHTNQLSVDSRAHARALAATANAAACGIVSAGVDAPSVTALGVPRSEAVMQVNKLIEARTAVARDSEAYGDSGGGHSSPVKAKLRKRGRRGGRKHGGRKRRLAAAEAEAARAGDSANCVDLAHRKLTEHDNAEADDSDLEFLSDSKIAETSSIAAILG